MRTPVTNRSYIHYREREGCVVVGCNFCGLRDGYHSYGKNAAAPLGWMRAVTSLEALVHVYKTSRRRPRDNNNLHTEPQISYAGTILMKFQSYANTQILNYMSPKMVPL